MRALGPEAWEAFTRTFKSPAHNVISLLLGGANHPEHPLHIYSASRAGRNVAILPRRELMRHHRTVPPSLPPSVEEAYRRKCIQLKQRMNEVEEANDASRQRIVRMERSIQKMRLERAFLLEQLSKRTSTNVEDSEGSPSPPPTVR